MLSWIPMNTRISGQPASVLLTLRTAKPFLEHMHLIFFAFVAMDDASVIFSHKKTFLATLNITKSRFCLKNETLTTIQPHSLILSMFFITDFA